MSRKPDAVIPLHPPKPTLTAWQRVLIARHPDRPHTLDYIQRLCTDFVEMHGDRLFGGDAAIIGGLACFDGQTVMVIGQQKGRSTKENITRNFGLLSLKAIARPSASCSTPHASASSSPS